MWSISNPNMRHDCATFCSIINVKGHKLYSWLSIMNGMWKGQNISETFLQEALCWQLVPEFHFHDFTHTHTHKTSIMSNCCNLTLCPLTQRVLLLWNHMTVGSYEAKRQAEATERAPFLNITTLPSPLRLAVQFHLYSWKTAFTLQARWGSRIKHQNYQSSLQTVF